MAKLKTEIEVFKNMKNLLLLAPLLLISTLPTQSQEQQSGLSSISLPLRTSGITGDQKSVTIPLKSTLAGLVVEVLIDGEPAELILDTGASSTFLTPEAVERLGLETVNDSESTGRDLMGVEQVAQNVWTGQLEIGDAWTKNELVLAGELPSAFGDGLLGISTLVDWDVRINPAEKTLTLFPSGDADPLDGETVIQLDSEPDHTITDPPSQPSPMGYYLYVPARIGSREFRATPDTGLGGILLAPSSLINVLAPEVLAKASPALPGTVSASGVKATRTAKLPEFTFGPDTLLELPVEISDATAGTFAERRGVIGLNLLRHYVMTFRFAAQELRLKPLGSVQQITRASSAGINLGIDDEGTFFILTVVPDGPAARAGIQGGDELLEIEGLPMEQMTPEEFSAFKLLPPGSKVTLRYRRNSNEPTDVTVELVER